MRTQFPTLQIYLQLNYLQINFGCPTFQTLAVLSFRHIFFGGYSGARSYYDTASDPVSSWHDTRRASKVGRRESGAQPSAELAGRTPAVHQRAYQPHQCTPLNQNHAHTVEPHLSQT